MKWYENIDLIHCDVRPANIMCNADGKPVLVDFGAARLADHAPALYEGTLSYGSNRVLTAIATETPIALTVADDLISFCRCFCAAVLADAKPTSRLPSDLERHWAKIENDFRIAQDLATLCRNEPPQYSAIIARIYRFFASN